MDEEKTSFSRIAVRTAEIFYQQTKRTLQHLSAAHRQVIFSLKLYLSGRIYYLHM